MASNCEMYAYVCCLANSAVQFGHLFVQSLIHILLKIVVKMQPNNVRSGAE